MAYYFIEALPMLLTTALPFAISGMWSSLTGRGDGTIKDQIEHPRTGRHCNDTPFLLSRRSLALVASSLILILSVVTHKEVRFIYPLLPMLHILAANPIRAFFGATRQMQTRRRTLLVVILLLNISLGGYMSLVHQRGVVDVVEFLRRQHEEKYLSIPDQPQPMTVGFMMPCHSTPWRSNLIYPTIEAWALTCEPPLNLSLIERQTYRDEADQFYDNTKEWLDAHMQTSVSGETAGPHNRRFWPEYLVFFGALESTLKEYFDSAKLRSSSYQEVWRGFNSQFHDDWRRRGDIVVWSRGPE